MPIVPRIPKSSADGTKEALHRQPLVPPRGMPPKQSSNNAGIAEGIKPEWCRNSDLGDHDPAQGRPHGSTYIHADAVRRHRGIEILLGDELWNDRLPDRKRQRAGYAVEKC